MALACNQRSAVRGSHAGTLTAPRHQHRVSRHRQAARSRPDNQRLRATAADSVTQEAGTPLQFRNLLLPILDSNEFLTDGSKQALATAASLARKDAGSVTVLVIDEPGTTTPREPEKQLECIRWHLENSGLKDYKVLEKRTTSPASVLIGDVADELESDMLVLSSMAVHSKYVDANQLSEFVGCPILVLPL